MRENRTYGSEGGESGLTGLPYPYRGLARQGVLWGKTHLISAKFELLRDSGRLISNTLPVDIRQMA